MPKICLKCGNSFPIRPSIGGRKRNFQNRKYCLDCSPLGSRNTIALHSRRKPPKWVDENCVRKAVTGAISIAEVLRKLGVDVVPGNYRTLGKYLKIYGIETSHIKGQRHGTSGFKTRVPDEQVYCKESLFSPNGLRNRLVRDKIIPYECSFCGLSEWKGYKLSLQVDHINGDPLDHRIPNLRFLCPNCHSITFSYRRPKKKRNLKEALCTECGKPISRKAERCRSCSSSNRGKFKIDWPSSEELRERTAESSFSAVARELGVSGNAIRRRLKDHPNS